MSSQAHCNYLGNRIRSLSQAKCTILVVKSNPVPPRSSMLPETQSLFKSLTSPLFSCIFWMVSEARFQILFFFTLFQAETPFLGPCGCMIPEVRLVNFLLTPHSGKVLGEKKSAKGGGEKSANHDLKPSLRDRWLH